MTDPRVSPGPPPPVGRPVSTAPPLATGQAPPIGRPVSTDPTWRPTPRSQRDRSYDRVGGSRLTGFGGMLLFIGVIAMSSPAQATDRTVLGVLLVSLVALFVIGILWPLIAIRFIRVAAVSPRDATVGDQVPVQVTLAGRSLGCELRVLDPTGDWVSAAAPSSGTIPHLADRRGVFHALRIEVRVTGALGVLAAHKVHSLALPYGVEVAPRPLEVAWQPAPAPIEGQVEPVMAGAAGVEVVRSVRPYEPGDPARLVHWPTSARTGALVVREMEPPAPFGQAIVVDLRDLGIETERAASYALGAALAVLHTGGRLILCTCEARGPVTEVVRYPIDAGRRLARAVVGPPGQPPEGWPVVEIGR